MTEQQPLPIRRAARVVLIDPEHRLLLFRSPPSPHHQNRHFWYPVGGEVEPGETHAEAAVREAFEETGLRDLQLGSEIFERRFVFRWRDKVWDEWERWFVAHVEHFEPVFGGMDEVELDFTDCRWLSAVDLADVQAAGDLLTPSNLLELLPAVLGGEVPGAPLSVGE